MLTPILQFCNLVMQAIPNSHASPQTRVSGNMLQTHLGVLSASLLDTLPVPILFGLRNACVCVPQKCVTAQSRIFGLLMKCPVGSFTFFHVHICQRTGTRTFIQFHTQCLARVCTICTKHLSTCCLCVSSFPRTCALRSQSRAPSAWRTWW